MSTDLIEQKINPITGLTESYDLLSGEAVEYAGIVPKVYHTAYSPELARYVCHLIRSGSTIAEAAEIAELKDTSTILYWRSSNADFKDALASARKDRALLHVESIQEEYNKIKENDCLELGEMNTSRHKVSLLEKLAKFDDPDLNGQGRGDNNKAGVYIINTGVPILDKQPITIEVKDEKKE